MKYRLQKTLRHAGCLRFAARLYNAIEVAVNQITDCMQLLCSPLAAAAAVAIYSFCIYYAIYTIL